MERNRPSSTKATAQAIGGSMSSLIMLECHLWLTMTEMKEADKVPFLDALVLSGSLFGPAVEGFAERFMEVHKSSQSMQHFLPKRTISSTGSSRPRPAPTQQIAKPMPATPEPRLPEGQRDRGRSRSARCYPFPKRQGHRPKIALDPAPARQKEKGPESRYCWTSPQAVMQALMCLSPPRLTLGAEESGFLVSHGPTIVPMCPAAVVADKVKHIYFQKESKNLFLPTISILPLCSQSAQPFKPLAKQAEAWQAISGVSAWVMTTVRRGYTLRFARRPRVSAVCSSPQSATRKPKSSAQR